MGYLNGKTIFVTGGTGSFGKRFVGNVLRDCDPHKVIVFSRDELKQYEMSALYPNEPRIRFFLGDVRDYDRLYRALEGVDVVVHAAALKQVPAAEYNPFEAVKTNIHGAQHIIDAALNRGVERVIALSTDKASSPLNLYGATKLVSDKLFVAANAYAGLKKTRFGVVRYGNVVGSRGSVVPFFQKLAAQGVTRLPITDERMTRFWITLEQGVKFVIDNFDRMHGGEIFVPKIPSTNILDLAKAILPEAQVEVIGIRPGEKLHEEMISLDDARRTVDMGSYFVIQPEAGWWDGDLLDGKSLPEGFAYNSETNDEWLSVEQLRDIIANV